MSSDKKRTEPSLEELLHLVHQYYPTGIEKEDPRYMVSAEAQRLTDLLQTHQKQIPAWKGCI